MNISIQAVCLAIPLPSCVYLIAWWQFTFLKEQIQLLWKHQLTA